MGSMAMRANNSRKSISLLSRYSADYGSLITRRRSEQALRSAAIESSMANRAKSEFLANMSHELRTPLNAIIGFSDLLEYFGTNDRGTVKTIEYAKDISRAGRHLLAIVSDILDMSKIESGTFSLDLGPYSIESAIDAAVRIIQPRIAAKRQKLLLPSNTNMPTINFDRRRVVQVILNLLTNAHKFTPETGEIELIVVADDTFVNVVIADTGIGMTDDQIVCALKPFGQVDSAYTRVQEGTGLGLPLAKALIAQHQGKFCVSSTPGYGTRVEFALPRTLQRTHGIESSINSNGKREAR